MYSVLTAIATSVLTLAAYPDNDPKTNRDGQNVIDSTDRSICQGVAPKDISLTKNDWTTRDLLTNGVLLERSMHFEPDAVEVVVKATTYRNNSGQIRVRSRIHMNPNTFEVLSSDSARTYLPLGEKFIFELSFDLSPMTVTYSFVGPCLQLKNGGDVMILTPKFD